ncbi:MAG: hypothetical protein WCK46_01095 [Candidatus Adlerbacteria bacterium]
MQVQYIIITENKGCSKSYGKFHAWSRKEVHSFHGSQEEANKVLGTLSPKKEDKSSEGGSSTKETTYQVISIEELNEMLPRYND